VNITPVSGGLTPPTTTASAALKRAERGADDERTSEHAA
jgi:hypothetical protein